MYNFLYTQVIKCAVGQYYISLAYLLSIPRLYPFFGLLRSISRGGYNREPTVIIIIININYNYNLDKYLQYSFDDSAFNVLQEALHHTRLHS